MNSQKNVPLANYTSFGIGGQADTLIEVSNYQELVDCLKNDLQKPLNILGFGSNTLISDKGLRGTTLRIVGGNIAFEDNKVIVDAGVWWDDLVRACIEKKLWGVELMSAVPGGVGGALYINITAYGQSVGPLVDWVEVWDTETKQVKKYLRNDLSWSYKDSIFQKKPGSQIILRACLNLSHKPTNELVYQKAIDVADELGLGTEDLENRRRIIIETRKRAGSLWNPQDLQPIHTAGSFFRNPIVSEDVAEKIISYDETGKTADQIKLMNKVHGGSSTRISAAHVMLAAGFKRGQSWNKVKLNDQNLLKVEAMQGATSQEVYDVAMQIKRTCLQKTNIALQPEVQIVGEFD